MSFQSLLLMQQSIKNLIESDSKLSEVITGIYFSGQTNPKYPFIILNITSVINDVINNLRSYSINFEIVICIKSKPVSFFYNIIDRIQSVVNLDKLQILKSLHNQSINFVSSPDFLHHKIIMNYVATIEEEVRHE